MQMATEPKKEVKERSDAERRARQCARLANLMRVLHLISGRGRWDVRTLAEELECSQRTVHRMLSTLSMAGVPWYFDEKIRAYKVRPGFKFPMVEQVTTDDMNSCSVESDVDQIQSATTQLIEDGEAFAESLECFLTAMKAISNRCQDS